jgi:PAS domain S-box-containing protein
MSDELIRTEPLIPSLAGAQAACGEAERPTAAAVGEELRALRAVVEGTARGTGEEFLQSLVRHLASALDVHYAFAAEFAGAPTRVRTLAFWACDRIVENVEYDLAGTPCEDVVRGGLCHHATGVKERFPQDKALVEMGIESYLGVPLLDGDGKVLGHLAVFDERPIPAEPRGLFIFRIFAARATAELERLRTEHQLLKSERRYRELYENAPTGYVSVGRDGRLRSVNRRAAELFGYPAEELVGMPILSLVGDTPAGKARSSEVRRKFLAGEGVCGWELEMRRKDGRPLWISLWMEPGRGEDGTIEASRSCFVDITDRVLAEAERARLHEQNVYLQEEIKGEHNFEQIIGQSPALRESLDNVCRVAPTDASVLISGETGTGKELIARAIHSFSKRKDKPLIKVNCAALPAGLVESELFGHEKGAFSGAIAKRLGRFELADGGTIFLDEIGELPAEAQVKLLRVLQEREFDRVGGTSPIRVDVRVIAASNRDLGKAVHEKTFREDLYYRLNVFPIHLPALRERPEDIPLLVHFLVTKFTTRIGKHLDGVSRLTMQRLQEYPWPGNIRELENVLERAVILATGTMLESDSDLIPRSSPAPAAPLAPAPTEAGGPAPALTVPSPTIDQPLPSMQTVERQHILAVLQQTDWVITGPRGAAKILALHPSTLRNRMKKLGITRSSHHMR